MACSGLASVSGLTGFRSVLFILYIITMIICSSLLVVPSIFGLFIWPIYLVYLFGLFIAGTCQSVGRAVEESPGQIMNHPGPFMKRWFVKTGPEYMYYIQADNLDFWTQDDYCN